MKKAIFIPAPSQAGLYITKILDIPDDVGKYEAVPALRAAYNIIEPSAKFIDVSTRSDTKLGVALSPYNVSYTCNGKTVSIESAYHGSKVLRDGSTHQYLYKVNSYHANMNRATKNKRPIRFKFYNTYYSADPAGCFFYYIYLKTLYRYHPQLIEQAVLYTAYSDITYTPTKHGYNQASACAILHSLYTMDKLDVALQDVETLAAYIYGNY